MEDLNSSKEQLRVKAEYKVPYNRKNMEVQTDL
jgi:hypothetical protein